MRCYLVWMRAAWPILALAGGVTGREFCVDDECCKWASDAGVGACTSYFRSTVLASPITKTTTSVVATITAFTTIYDFGGDAVAARAPSPRADTTLTSWRGRAGTAPGQAQGLSGAEKLVGRGAHADWCPTVIPGWNPLPLGQSVCSNAATFSSACSCVGIIHETVVMPACTTTFTVLSTAMELISVTQQAGQAPTGAGSTGAADTGAASAPAGQPTISTYHGSHSTYEGSHSTYQGNHQA